MSEQQFQKSDLLQDAVVRQSEIIGEASRNLSDEFRDKHTQIPWTQIIGLRNRIVHGYVNLDTEIVWEVAHNDLPTLK